MTPDQRLEKIGEFVQSHINEMAEEHPREAHNPVYRWEHTLRVTHYGENIAEAEKADVEIVVAAYLLHDVAHFECDDDYKGHGRVGAKITANSWQPRITRQLRLQISAIQLQFMWMEKPISSIMKPWKHPV